MVYAFRMESLELQNDFLQISEKDYYDAIARYNESDRMVQDSMEIIRQWYRMQPHLPPGALSDDRLFRHLLAVGFSIEKTKTKIDNMMTSCTIMPDIMRGRDPCAEWAQRARSYARIAILPQLNREDMTRVMVIDFTEKDTSELCMVDVFKLILMVCDYRLCIDITRGEHYVVDFGTARLGHMVKMTPALIKKGLFLLQGCFGAKIKGIHYVNVPAYAEFAITIVKAGLSKKLADRLHIHTNHESLHKVFPKSTLPKEMGGEIKSMEELADDTMAELCKPKWRQWFIEQDRFKTDENKRAGIKSDMSNELLGMHGLDID